MSIGVCTHGWKTRPTKVSAFTRLMLPLPRTMRGRARVRRITRFRGAVDAFVALQVGTVSHVRTLPHVRMRRIRQGIWRWG